MPVLYSVALLICSNVFMTFAWYAHLKNHAASPWWMAALASWGIALFEYLLQVPANRIGYGVLNLSQLKIIQEVISLSVFIPFAVLYMDQPFKWDYVWAALCILGAVYFMFRGEQSVAPWHCCAVLPYLLHCLRAPGQARCAACYARLYSSAPSSLSLKRMGISTFDSTGVCPWRAGTKRQRRTAASAA
jgi:uncharacterized protein (DUF486 family)